MSVNWKSHLFFYCVIAKNKKEKRWQVSIDCLSALNINNARVIKTRIEREKKGLAKVVVEIKHIREFLIVAQYAKENALAMIHKERGVYS